jgi:hypothetical protein
MSLIQDFIIDIALEEMLVSGWTYSKRQRRMLTVGRAECAKTVHGHSCITTVIYSSPGSVTVLHCRL